MHYNFKELKVEDEGSTKGPFSFILWFLKKICIPITIPVLAYNFLHNIRLRKQMAELQGKVVVITGASSGIGEQLAHCFYAQGCRVVLASRRIDELNRVKNDLLRMHPTVPAHPPIVMQLDLADLNSFTDQVTKIIDIFGHIDILVNNAGMSFGGTCASTNIDVDIKIMLINYFAQIALTKAVLKYMIERKSGHIVYMSSMQGKLALPYRSAYGASKHALQAFCDTLRTEIKQYNIDVTIVSPAYVKTSLSLNALTENGNVYGQMDERTLKGMSPVVVAMETVKAVALKHTDVSLSSFMARLAVLVRAMFPSLYTWAMILREKLSKPKTF